MFPQEISKIGTEGEKSTFLYAKARALFLQDPTMALRRSYKNIVSLVGNVTSFLMYGYSHVHHISYPWILAIPGLFVFYLRTTRREIGFWLLMFASTVASAAIIFADDGWRVMHVSWVLVALFVSFGFVSPLESVVSRWRCGRPIASVWIGVGSIVVAGGMMLVSPLISYLWWHSEFAPYVSLARAADAAELVVSGRSISGFLIIPDDRPLRRVVPSMHLSVFSQIVRNSHLEQEYGPFLAALPTKLPVAFLSASTIGLEGPVRLYVAPAEMLTNRHVVAWRLLLDGDTRDCTMCNVAEAKPLP